MQQKIKDEAISGTIRKAEHFLRFMRKIIKCIKDELKDVHQTRIVSPLTLLNKMQQEYYIDQRPLRNARERLTQLLNNMQIDKIDEYSSLNLIADFATMLATFYEGFSMILEPYPEENKGLGAQTAFDPILQFYCMDASIATQPVFDRYQNVILTSGTISPIDMYAKILNFKPQIVKAFDIQLPRNAIRPLIVTKGLDQTPITSKFDERDNKGNIKNQGRLLVELSQIVPDGIVVFFTSYKYMENIILQWNEMKILQEIQKSKLIYIETKNNLETVLALENYKKACDNGRGGVFFSIARGKVSEGVDFAGHYGRAVVIFGVPY